MKKRKLLLSLLLAATLTGAAANESTSVAQVTAPVTLSEDVDYHVTSAEPFATAGSIDITNTATAVVIFDKLKPSEVGNWLSHVTINGAKAVSGTNCEVRIYNAGAMLLPYNGTNPLTVFTEKGFGGTSANSYSVNTIYSLANNKTINNHIRSFKLKRGYMVCFATQSNGQGYSRVFIADQADVEMDMPNVLDKRVSFIRISKWNNVHKRGWAGWWNDDTQKLLNTSWCYNWDASDHKSWVDREYVTQHHHEGWPGIADVGNNSGSANILGNNEPDNKADDKEQDIDVKNVLANWPQMMATGKRLGSPAVSSNYSWLYEFIDSIDARGWRCDFIAVHAYWYKDQPGWKSQLENISKRCGNRPIWITEMNYGANWTGWPGSGTDGTDANYAIEKQHMGPVLDYLNDAPYIERYAFYNNVQACRYAIADGKLTPIGEYYANLPEKLAYNPDYEYVPKDPKVVAPSDLTVVFAPRNKVVTLNWINSSGEFADSMFVERKDGKNGTWERVATVDVNESTTYKYSAKDNVTTSGNFYYRVRIVDYKGRSFSSAEVNNTVNGTEGTEDFQWGTMSAANDEENYNFYHSGFSEIPAIVFGGSTSNNTSTRFVETVPTVTTSYFTSNYFVWNCESDANDFSKGEEKASYLVVQPGNGTLGTLHYEAGLLKNDGKDLRVGGDTVEYKFNEPFKEAPVVFVTPISTYKKCPLLARVWDITNEGFKVVLTRQYGTKETYPNILTQRLSYVAIEKGVGAANGKKFTVGDSLLTFKYPTSTNTIEFAEEQEDPVFLCQYQTFNSDILTILRQKAPGVTSTECVLRIGVDTTDPNKSLGSANPLVERVGWMTISTDKNATGIHTVESSKANDLSVEVSGGVLNVYDAQASSVRVYTVSGSNVASAQLTEGAAHFPIDAMPSGVLIVKTNTGKAVKLVVRR